MSPDPAPPDHNPLHCKAPYGFTWHNGRLVHHPAEAPVRKKMYELLVQLGKRRAVVQALNSAGHRTREGFLWSEAAIERLIRDATAKGVYPAMEGETPGLGAESAATPSGGPAAGQIPPIISPELWEQCNGLLETSELGHRRGRQAIHLFAGLLVCHCGRRMYIRTHSADYRCSRCGNRIPAEDLEAIYLEQMECYCQSPAAAALPVQNLHRQWGALEHREKRQLIESITERIVAAADEVDVTFYELATHGCDAPPTTPASSESAAVAPQPLQTQPAIQNASANSPAARATAGATSLERPAPKIDPVALAVAMMKDHPDWSARKLAQAAGCSHTTLTRSALFRTAKALAAAKADRRKGWKTVGGDVEAIADGNED